MTGKQPMAIEIGPLEADRLLESWIDTRDTVFRDQLIAHHLPLVYRLCARFQHEGEHIDQLVRAAAIGLVKAIDGFDPQAHKRFSAFAIPAIVGEIKTYFPTQGWGVTQPAKLKLRKLLVARTAESLAHQLGRSPNLAEIGGASGLSQEEVVQSFEADRAPRLSAPDIDLAHRQSNQHTVITEPSVQVSAAPRLVADKRKSSSALANFDPREQIVFYMRYYSGLSQNAIARRLGISRIHVSQLQLRAVARLKLSLRHCLPG